MHFRSLYNVAMKRNSVYLACVLFGAVVVDQALDRGLTSVWEYSNKGLLFKDLVSSRKVGNYGVEEE